MEFRMSFQEASRFERSTGKPRQPSPILACCLEHPLQSSPTRANLPGRISPVRCIFSRNLTLSSGICNFLVLEDLRTCHILSGA